MVTAAGLSLLARFVIECLEHRIVLCISEVAPHYQVRLGRWGGSTEIKARELQQRHNTYCQLRTGPSGTPLVRPYHDSHYQSQMSIVYAVVIHRHVPRFRAHCPFVHERQCGPGRLYAVLDI